MGLSHGVNQRIRRFNEVAELLRKGTDDSINLGILMGGQGPSDLLQDGAAVNRT